MMVCWKFFIREALRAEIRSQCEISHYIGGGDVIILVSSSRDNQQGNIFISWYVCNHIKENTVKYEVAEITFYWLYNNFFFNFLLLCWHRTYRDYNYNNEYILICLYVTDFLSMCKIFGSKSFLVSYCTS